MEQLLLGLFQEQLAKIIVGFRKEQVNANLLNGKGEITDVSINCSVLNQGISKVSPYFEFEQIHVSRLGFHVTAWSNLRKAPIIVDIGTIAVDVKESLNCLPKKQRKRAKMITEKDLAALFLEGVYKPLRGKGPYGLMDRIVDNIQIEIDKIQINFQTWGKFKTRRPGLWTPPKLMIELNHLKIVAVDPNGNEGNPDSIWAHNRDERVNYMLYKKVSFDCSVTVKGNDPNIPPATLLRGMRLVVQAAIKRRIKDGAILGVQADITIPSVDVDIDAENIPLLAHFATGMQYCFAKNRPFEDPLKSLRDSSRNLSGNQQAIPIVLSKDSIAEGDEELEESTKDDDDDDDDGIAVDQGNESEASFDGDENDQTTAAKQDTTNESLNNNNNNNYHDPVTDRPIIVLPSGLVIYEDICITLSVHSVKLRGFYPDEQEGFIQFVAKGCIVEAIWPKMNHEFGLYTQVSVAFATLQECLGRNMKTVLMGGMRQQDHSSFDESTAKPREVNVDENFPLFERRSLRDDPIDVRHSFPTQAFGVKTTVDFIKPGDLSQVMVVHEVGIDQLDVVLDAGPWSRTVKFALNESGGGFDPRWHSGDWSDILTTDMLHHPSEELNLDDHIQPAKQILLDDNFMVSSDYFNATARFTSVNFRIPAALEASLRSADVLLETNEITLIISSALPRTFLSGKIGKSLIDSGSTNDNDDVDSIDFPNDPSDISYYLEKKEDPALRQQGVETSGKASTFRLQLTTRGFQMKIKPIVTLCNAPEPQQLIAPVDSTMLVCFEGEPPEPGSNAVKLTLFVSIQLHKVIFNVDLDVLTGGIMTILHHADVVMATQALAKEILPHTAQEAATYKEAALSRNKNQKVKKTLRGRRVMVRRHLSQSRETGELAIVFCLHQSEFGLTIWRQNVPISSLPNYNDSRRSKTRQRDDGNNNYTTKEEQEQQLLLMKLIDIHLTNFEIGIEYFTKADQQQQQQKESSNGNSGGKLVKCCLQSFAIKVCDVNNQERYETNTRTMSTTTSTDSQTDENDDGALQEQRQEKGERRGRGVDDLPMVDLLAYGSQDLPGDLQSTYSGREQHFALRVEEQVHDFRSWSVAGDLTSPAVITLHVDEMKDAIHLLIEALLLPTWWNMPMTLPDDAPFPDGTVGGFLYALSAKAKAGGDDIQPDLNIDTSSTKGGVVPSEAMIERVLKAVMKHFLPSDLRLVLGRLEIANLMISIPTDEVDDDNDDDDDKIIDVVNNDDVRIRKTLGLLLNHTDVRLRFATGEKTTSATEEEKSNLGVVVPIENVLTCKGMPWSKLIPNLTNVGYYQYFLSQQSLISVATATSSAITTTASDVDDDDDNHNIVSTTTTTSDVLVDPFDIGLTYEAAKINMDVNNNKLMVKDIRKIEAFLWQLKSLAVKSHLHIKYIKELLISVRKNPNYQLQQQSHLAVEMNGNGAIDNNNTNGDMTITDPTMNNNSSSTSTNAIYMTTSENLKSTRILFEKVYETFASYEKDIQQTLNKKHVEIESLKRSIYVKETQRIGTLALLSSKLSGWIRMGGLHRTGQRVARKSTMWAYWAVLRKDLLLLYNNPGETRPADVVLLVGSKLRQLGGGRNRHEVKRGFAVIESTGTTRFFIVASAPEYATWVKELRSTLAVYSPHPIDEENMLIDNPPMESLERNESSIDPEGGGGGGADAASARKRLGMGLGNRFAATKNRIGSALQTARQRGKDAFDPQRQVSSNEFSIDNDSAVDGSSELSERFAVSSSIGEDDTVFDDGTERSTAFDSVIENSEEMTAGTGTSSEISQTGARRRLQFGKKLSDVGDLTKSKIGSAFQTARQKGAEISGRRLRQNVSGSLDMDADNSENQDDSGRQGPGKFSSRLGSAFQQARQIGRNATPDKPPRPLAGFRGKLKGLTPGRSDATSSAAGLDSTEFQSEQQDPSDMMYQPDELPADGDYSWTCEVCTYINNTDNVPVIQMVCEMCGSERQLTNQTNQNDKETEVEAGDEAGDEAPTDDKPDEAEEQQEQEEQTEVVDEAIATTQDDVENANTESNEGEVKQTPVTASQTQAQTQPEPERQGGLVAAAVSSNPLVGKPMTGNGTERGKNGGGGGGRFNFRRPGGGRAGGENDIEAKIVRNVHATGRIPTVDVTDRVFIPLKKFQGTWMVTVECYNPVNVQNSSELAATSVAAAEVTSKEQDGETEGTPKDINGEENENENDAKKSADDNKEEESSAPSDGKTEEVTEEEKAKQAEEPEAKEESNEKPLPQTFDADFQIQIKRVDGDGKKHGNVVKYCTIGDILQLHSEISESVDTFFPQLLTEELLLKVDRENINRTNVGSSNRRAVQMVVEKVESTLVVGAVLVGLIDVNENSDMFQKTQRYQAEAVESFLNSAIDCPLPIDALAALSELLGINASTRDVLSKLGHMNHIESENTQGKGTATENDNNRNNNDEDAIIRAAKSNPLSNGGTSSFDFVDTKRMGQTSVHSKELFTILSNCESRLVRADKICNNLSKSNVLQGGSNNNNNNHVLPGDPFEGATIVADRFQAAMHQALMRVMAERDDAHAKLIAANVLHIHAVEQEKRTNQKLQMELQFSEEFARLKQLQHASSFFGGKVDDQPTRALEAKIESFERVLAKNGDEEMAALCHQLAGEISAKTSHALEIIRLKETRELERQTESDEKRAMKEEMERLKKRLDEEQKKREQAEREVIGWKSSYETLAGSLKED